MSRNGAAPPLGVYALACVPVLLWGSSFVAVKIALSEVSPLGVVAARAVLGLATLSLVLALSRPARTAEARRGDPAKMVFLGVLGVVLQTGLQAFALRLTSAQNAGWLVTLIPIFTALLSALFLREAFPVLKSAGVALGFAGALLVTLSGPGAGSFALPSTRGDLLMLLSAFNWAVYTLVARDLFVRRGALRTTVRILAAGTVAAVALYLTVGGAEELRTVSLKGWVALAFLGVGCTALAFLAWARALERLEPGTLTAFQYLQPLVTVFVAALVLSEPVRLSTLGGGLVALSGVVLVQHAARIGAASR